MDNIESLKRLAGIETTYENNNVIPYDTRTVFEKKLIEQERGIKPGSAEWFDLWFTFPNKTTMSPGFRGRRK